MGETAAKSPQNHLQALSSFNIESGGKRGSDTFNINYPLDIGSF